MTCRYASCFSFFSQEEPSPTILHLDDVLYYNANEFNSRLVQVLLILVCAQVMFTYAIQLYVPVTIVWPMVAEKFGPFKYELLILLVFRTTLVLLTR